MTASIETGTASASMAAVAASMLARIVKKSSPTMIATSTQPATKSSIATKPATIARSLPRSITAALTSQQRLAPASSTIAATVSGIMEMTLVATITAPIFITGIAAPYAAMIAANASETTRMTLAATITAAISATETTVPIPAAISGMTIATGKTTARRVQTTSAPNATSVTRESAPPNLITDRVGRTAVATTIASFASTIYMYCCQRTGSESSRFYLRPAGGRSI